MIAVHRLSRPVAGALRLFFAFFAVLLLTLALNGGLTLGALYKVQLESVSAVVRVVGHDWALRIQGAIRFGKPRNLPVELPKEAIAQIDGNNRHDSSFTITNILALLGL